MRVGINVIPLNSGHKKRGIGYYSNNLIKYLSKDIEIIEFIKISEVNNVDLIHYPWFDFYFHTLPIRKRFKTVVTIHDTIPLLFPSEFPAGIKGRINFLLQKIAIKKADAIISDSEISKKDITRYLGVNKDKITSIPLAAEEEFHPLNETKLLLIKRKFKLADKFLLYVGDANWTKNLPFLIEGFANLIKGEGLKNTELVLVGEVFLKNVENIDHPEIESLKRVNRLIKQLNLQDRIRRPGYIEKEDLVGFYNLATIFVQPSIYEGFGLPIVQAFSCGTPVVSSNGGSLKEVGGDAAIYFDPNNLEQFIKELEEVLLNTSLQKKLSSLGLRRALNFSWEETATKTLEVYSKVIKNE